MITETQLLIYGISLLLISDLITFSFLLWHLYRIKEVIDDGRT